MQSVAVFCGSNFGAKQQYAKAAAQLGDALANRSLTLIYGGTHKGLMGVLADAALDNGGTVTGVITERLAERGHSHARLSHIEIVPDMATRKRFMATRADAFVVLPGGIGTLEELFEVWVANQLEAAPKPIGLLDIEGFFAPLLSCIDHMIGERFLPASHRQMLIIDRSVDVLLDRLVHYQPVTTPKWL